MLITSRPLWFAATNTYVVARERGGPAVVIDAPPDVDGVADQLASIDCYPAALLVTHGHIDHVGGAGAAVERWNVAAYLHPDDDWLATDPASQLRSIMGVSLPPEEVAAFAPPASFTRLGDGDRVVIGDIAFDVLHTPGHTPGHCCFHLAEEATLFSGDQLFAGSIGRTDLPGGDYDTLMTSMKEKVVPLPAETRVLPGHGPATTLAVERAQNPFLQGL